MTTIQTPCSIANNYIGTLTRFIDSCINTPMLWDEKPENQILISELLGYHSASFSYYDGPIAEVKEKEYLLQYVYCDGSFTCDHDSIPFYLFIKEYDPKKPGQYDRMIKNNTGMYCFDKNDESFLLPYHSDNEKKMHQELFQYCNDMIKPDNDVRLAPFLIEKPSYGT